MARPTIEQTLADVHAAAVKEFDVVQSAQRDVRKECLQDRRFYSIAGAQWEGDLQAQFDNKMRFEFNKVHLAIIRIINDYRNNRITVTFAPKKGGKDDGVSDVCAGLYRATEQDSAAEEAYDNAFEEAVGGGFGAFRLCSEYEDEEDEDDEQQCIRIKPIFDADARAFFDLGAKRQDKADAKRCWVLTAMTPQDYEEEWGDDPASWPAEVHQHEFDWATPNVVYVAEFYKVEEKKEVVQAWEQKATGETVKHYDKDFEEDPALKEMLIATGWSFVKSKKIERKRVHKYIMNGMRILEDCGIIAGPAIPVVPVYGKRWFVDNVERCMGHVRLAKDPQRLKNVQITQVAELAAKSGIEKPIFTPEQVSGHQTMWAEDNVKDYPYLLVNPIIDANGQPIASGPIAYTKTPQIPPATAALMQITDFDMKEILGNAQQGEQMVSNISSKTVEMIQERLDMQTFIYMSNMAKAVKRAGEIWLGMAKEIFVEEGRKLKTVDNQDKVSSIELMRPKMNESGGVMYEGDLSASKLDAYVDVGPSSSSSRRATVSLLKEMMALTAGDPQTAQVLSSMIMMNMEGEGIAEVREFFRQRLIRMGVVKPTEEEAKKIADEQAGQQPSATDQYMLAAAAEAEAKAKQANANTLLTLNNADKAKADILKILSEIDQAEKAQIIEALKLLDVAAPSTTSAQASAQPASAPVSPVELPAAVSGQPPL